MSRDAVADAWHIQTTRTRIDTACSRCSAPTTHLDFQKSNRQTLSPYVELVPTDSLPQNMEITIVMFSRCVGEPPFHFAEHLLVTKKMFNLESKKAIAVSYAIGDFGRKKHTFGHLDDASETIVKLEFSGEWYIEWLQETLVQLSVAHGAIWMDQLSLTQDTVQLSAALQSLKKIYGTLEVVIFFYRTLHVLV